MARRLTRTVATWGWSAAADLCALLVIAAGLMLAGIPLAAWRVLTQSLYRGVVAYLPLPVVLATLVLAGALSASILRRICRLLFAR